MQLTTVSDIFTKLQKMLVDLASVSFLCNLLFRNCLTELFFYLRVVFKAEILLNQGLPLKTVFILQSLNPCLYNIFKWTLNFWSICSALLNHTTSVLQISVNATFYNSFIRLKTFATQSSAYVETFLTADAEWSFTNPWWGETEKH